MASSSSSSPDGARFPGNKTCEPHKLQPGTFVSCCVYYEVTSQGNQTVTLRTIPGNSYSNVTHDILATEFFTTEVLQEQKVTPTFLAEFFPTCKDAIIKVTFHKKPDPSKQAELLKNFQDDGKDDRTAKRKRNDMAKQIITGEERIMIGYVKQTTDKGRVIVFDLQKKEDRQVDLRTLQEVVYKNVLYHIHAKKPKKS